MHANNETGVLQPVGEIAALLADTKTLFHIDAAQTFGKEVEALRGVRCHFLSISAHKIYGPKGVGALYARREKGQRRPLTPLQSGGGQEMGYRPGTIPVPLVVGLGTAAELAGREHQDRRREAAGIKERFLEALRGVEYRVNGDPARTLPHVINLGFPGIDSEALMLVVREDLAFSNGAACNSDTREPSHVLRAMGLDDARIEEAFRLSWGPGVGDIPADVLINAVRSL